jgi:hypothetical protein
MLSSSVCVVQCTAQCIDTILLNTNLCNVLNPCPIFNIYYIRHPRVSLTGEANKL